MYKAFDAGGLAALANQIKSTKQTADASSSAVAEMGEDFQELVQQVANCITELDEVKADLSAFGVCDASVE